MDSKEFSLLDFNLFDLNQEGSTLNQEGSTLNQEGSTPEHGMRESLVVSIAASAGTGKTTTITAIILRMVITGRDIEKIAALTYTKVAAMEMRLRVRAGLIVLYEQLQQNKQLQQKTNQKSNANDHSQLSANILKELPTLPQLLKICEGVGWAVAMQRIAIARHKIGQAMFATIHSFADSLVSIFGYAIGVYDQLKEVDESTETTLKEKLIAKAWATHFYTPKGAPSCVLYAAMASDKKNKFCISSYGNFKEIILATLNDPSCSVHVAFPDSFFADTTKGKVDYRQVCCLQNKYLEKLQKEFAQHLQKGRESISTTHAPESAASADSSKAELDCIEKFMQEHFIKVNFLLNLKIATIAEEIKIQFEKVRRENGINSFNDSLENLHKLSQNRSVADSFYNTYQVLLIDEAQDCNAFQFNALFNLFSHKQQGIIIVGDDKQSIYSFQGADVAQYLKIVRMADRRFHLSINYRTSPQLLCALNEVYCLASTSLEKQDGLAINYNTDSAQKTEVKQTIDSKGSSDQAPPPNKVEQNSQKKSSKNKKTVDKKEKNSSKEPFSCRFFYEDLLKYPPAVFSKKTPSSKKNTAEEKHEEEPSKNSDSFPNNGGATYPLIKISDGSKTKSGEATGANILEILCSEISTIVSNKNTNGDSIAVLLSSNTKINELSQLMQQWKIPHHIKSTKGNNSVLDCTAYSLIKKLLDALLAHNKIDSQAALKKCLSSILFAVKRKTLANALQKMTPKLEKIKDLLIHNGTSVALMATLSLQSSDPMAKTIGESLLMHENGEEILSNYKQIAQLYAKAEHHKRVLSTSRFSYQVATVDITAELEQAKKLMAETAFGETLFPRFRQESDTLPVLLTLHGAKGLEFDHVFLYFSKTKNIKTKAIPRRLLEKDLTEKQANNLDQTTCDKEKSVARPETQTGGQPLSETKPKIEADFLKTEKTILIDEKIQKKHKKAIQQFENLEEGARRLYVALTRAKKSVTAIVTTNKGFQISESLQLQQPVFPLVVPQIKGKTPLSFEQQIKENFDRINNMLLEEDADGLFKNFSKQNPLEYKFFEQEGSSLTPELEQQRLAFLAEQSKQSAKKIAQPIAVDKETEIPLKIKTINSEGYIESFTSLKKKVETLLKVKTTPSVQISPLAKNESHAKSNKKHSIEAGENQRIDRELTLAYDDGDFGEDSRDHDAETADTTQQAEINKQTALAAYTETQELSRQNTAESDDRDIAKGDLPASSNGQASKDSPQKEAPQTPFSFATMESSKKVGSLFHKIMQNINFSQCSFPKKVESDSKNEQEVNGASDDPLLQLSRRSLQQNGIDQRFAKGLAESISNVLHTPLLYNNGKTFCLAQLQSFQVLKEETFFFPTSASQSTLRRRLAEFIAHHDSQKAAEVNSNEDFPTSAYAETPLRGFSPKSGHIKGEIDLVFFHDQRYYLLDWKTNRMGDTLESYNTESLHRVMLQEKYHLQHALYLLALDRFLQARLRESYSYQAHFGGVFYIFVRGIAPVKHSTPIDLAHNGKSGKGVFKQKGVYFTHPTRAELLAFKKIFT